MDFGQVHIIRYASVQQDCGDLMCNVSVLHVPMSDQVPTRMQVLHPRNLEETYAKCSWPKVSCMTQLISQLAVSEMI